MCQPTGGSPDGSGMSREAHVPFYEGLGVQFPRPTHRFGVRFRDAADLLAQHGLTVSDDVWVANYYSARNPLRLSSLVILGVVARMFRGATRSSCWCT